MKNLSVIALALGLFCLPHAASATGGVWCDAEDANVAFHFKAVMSRDGTGGWFDIDGSVETRFGTLPKHLARFDIKDDTLTERWLGRDEVLLQIQKYDPEPSRAVMLTIMTKSVEEATYQGTYELRVTAESGDEAYITRTGAVSCGAD